MINLKQIIFAHVKVKLFFTYTRIAAAFRFGKRYTWEEQLELHLKSKLLYVSVKKQQSIS